MFILLIIFSLLVVFILLPVSFIAFIIGLIEPSLFGFALQSAAIRKNLLLLSSAVFALTTGVPITDVITFGGKHITINVPAQKEGIPSITPSVVCLPVPQDIITSINQGLTIQGGGTFQNAQAVKSTDYKSVYFISGDLQGSGLEGDGDIATFARNGELDGSGMIIAVDAVANEFSDWADGRTMRLPMTMSDSGASQSQACVSEQ